MTLDETRLIHILLLCTLNLPETILTTTRVDIDGASTRGSVTTGV